MEAKRKCSEPTAPPAVASAAAMASVLGNDDLLREIMLRLGFPTCLVRAALVSKRWLRHASDRDFLHRFRRLHPPRLLGFYVRHFGPDGYRGDFAPLPQPPELAAPLRRAVSSRYEDFDESRRVVMDCRNGRVVISFGDGSEATPRRHALISLLHAGEPVAILPRTPEPLGVFTRRHRAFLEEGGGGGGGAVTFVNLNQAGRRISAQVYDLRPDGWSLRATGEIELPEPGTHLLEWFSSIHGKVYVMTARGYTLGLGLGDGQLFILELPDGVRGNIKLSCAEEGSGVYLVHLKRYQLSVWLHRMTDAGGWVLVDTFCVLEACKRLGYHSSVPKSGGYDEDYISLVTVGDNAEFVFLDLGKCGIVVHVHMKSRMVKKVYQRMPGVSLPAIINPVVMVWPPVFPVPNEGHDHDE